MSSLIFVAIWATVVGFMAKKRERSFWGYLFLSFIITPLITMVILLIIGEKKDSQPSDIQPQLENNSVYQATVKHIYTPKAENVSSETWETHERQPKQQAEIVREPEPVQETSAAEQTKKPRIKYCSSCGKRIGVRAKFCPECGASTSSEKAADSSSPNTSYESVNPNTRQQEFAGNILKCPNCGAVIEHTTAVCPECGHHITGQAAVSSVQAFNNQLMAIEETRKDAAHLGMFNMFNAYAPADAADKKKLTLIRNFPIPNTIDDIMEFMMLAIANIDVGLSKNTRANKVSSTNYFAMEMPKVISNAWVSKMQQAYQKAKIMFPNEPAFAYVRELYVDKMTELKMKVDD